MENVSRYELCQRHFRAMMERNRRRGGIPRRILPGRPEDYRRAEELAEKYGWHLRGGKKGC